MPQLDEFERHVSTSLALNNLKWASSNAGTPFHSTHTGCSKRYLLFLAKYNDKQGVQTSFEPCEKNQAINSQRILV